MIVVADTTPLNYLIRLGYPEVLEAFYGEVIVPTAVLAEMQDEGAPQIVKRWVASPPLWIRHVPALRLDASLPTGLGSGDVEAISLAMELSADVLLMDELDGRRYAEERHLPVTGTLTVLLQASLRGYCEFPEAMLRLRQHGFWLSSALETMMLKRYEKAKNRR